MRCHRIVVSLSIVLFSACFVRPASAADATQMDQDIERLQTWAATYGDPRLLQEDPAKLADVVAQAPQVREEVKQITARWEPQAKSREGQKVNNALHFFKRNFDGYESRIDMFTRDGPGQITSHLDEAEKLSDEAVAEKKPLFFTGGVPQRMKWAEDKLAVLNAIDPAAAKPLQARYDAVKPTIPQKEAALRDEIIAANEPPRDNYSGPDKAQLVEMLKSAWTAKHPGDAIVAVSIPGQQWKRDTRWQWQRGSRAWEKMDRSKLQGQLLVKSTTDPKLLEVHVVDLYKDHMSGDAIKPVCWEKENLPVQNLVLATKVK